ncbi:flagellar biosynthetic protein FliR [Frondihabitans sp. PhB188]|uniref:flagellar biosynthetic protein FliR n=1 Tax=Frondihabitans sp. PhB188 TaxID=2485200 RepID=UPI000F4AAE6F|nr:flagellar biosynthetic protein FliR [Frondihabitans sp. PhB188]ROQ37359.1 flagellar biosynthetic protein FliR [Frondihabitans sp. PhB188]
MGLSFSMGAVEAVMLASVRIVAFLMIAPPFNHSAIPARVKAMLSVGLALAVAPVVVPGYVEQATGAFFVSLILSLVTGAVLGFLVWLAFAAVQSAGSAIDLFGGFQLAMGYDPGSQVNGAQFTRIFQMTSLVLLFTSGGYLLVIGGLLRTFDAIPVSGGLDLAHPAQLLVSTTSSMFLSTLQIAGPLIVILFLADAGLGLLTRVAPALNAFQLGYPLKIMITLGLAGMVFVALPQVVSSLSREAVDIMLGAVS